MKKKYARDGDTGQSVHATGPVSHANRRKENRQNNRQQDAQEKAVDDWAPVFHA